MIKKTIIFTTLFLILSIVMMGCQNDSDDAHTNPTNTQNDKPIAQATNTESAYPPPQSEPDQNESYPIESYPIESEETISINRGPDFNVSEPINRGEKIVEGTGPAGVPIILINVSTGGTVLDETTIKQDGSFKFELNQPLESGHSIGIQLGDISDTDLDPNDFIYNENYYDRPIVGILFDMVIVE